MKSKDEKKLQTTIYLTCNDKAMVNKLMAKSLLSGKSSSVTDVISKAIHHFYKVEFKEEKG